MFCNPKTIKRIKNEVGTGFKYHMASHATADCILRGIGEQTQIEALTISKGEGSFLPLRATVTANGETRQVESIQPEWADFDYPVLCEDFNKVVAENEEMGSRFLQDTACQLNLLIKEKGIAKGRFSTVID